MENKKIRFLNEVDKYKDELKKIKVWVCSTSSGKSYLCSLDDRFFDLDAYQWHVADLGDKDYEKRAIEKMYELIKDGKIVLQASHTYFINYLSENNIPFVLLYGKPEMQDEICQRMLHRGSGEDFVQRFGVKVAEHFYQKTNDTRSTISIEINPKEYVKDYAWKVFGKPKKYILHKDFTNKTYKIAFIDIDHTLLNIKGELTSNTIKTIKEMKKKVKIVLTSGRSRDSVLPVLNELKLNTKEDIAICACGALLINGKGDIISMSEITREDFEPFKKVLSSDIKKFYFNTLNGRVNYKDIKNLDEFFEKNKVYKMSTDPGLKEKLTNEIFAKFTSYGGKNLLSFVKKGRTKEFAAKEMLKKYNLNFSDAIAIADEDFDVGLLKKVGCSVAVCNAEWNVKNKVKYITDSNNDEGVAQALKKIFG